MLLHPQELCCNISLSPSVLSELLRCPAGYPWSPSGAVELCPATELPAQPTLHSRRM